MPYRDNLSLPPAIRRLPEHAQDIWRSAFNNAFATHRDDPRREEAAHRIAWAAVKRRYDRIEGRWTERTASAAPPSYPRTWPPAAGAPRA